MRQIQIEHDPNESLPSNAPYWVIGIALVFSWSYYLYSQEFNWWPISLGLLTGFFLTHLAMEKIDKKYPGSLAVTDPTGPRSPVAGDHHVKQRPTRIIG